MALLVVASLRATCRAPGLPFTTSGLRVAGRRVRIAAGAGVAVAAAVTGSHGDSFVIADGVRGMVVGGGGEGHHEGYEEEQEERDGDGAWRDRGSGRMASLPSLPPGTRRLEGAADARKNAPHGMFGVLGVRNEGLPAPLPECE